MTKTRVDDMRIEMITKTPYRSVVLVLLKALDIFVK